MRILYGVSGIVIEGLENVPTLYDICKMDRRLICIPTATDSKGNMVNNAFLHTLEPTQFFTIVETQSIGDKLFILKTKKHSFDRESPILKKLYDSYCGEVYVGDVCDGSGKTGEVWHNTYKNCLKSKTLYNKNEDGTCTLVKPPIENCFSVPDRYGFRIVVKSPNEPEKHYAFFNGISAFNKWVNLKYFASEEQEVLNSFEKDYIDILYPDECREFEEYPQLVKAFPNSRSCEGFLNLK